VIKFASRRVSGWNDRHINQLPVYRALLARAARGYTLLADERQFVGDVASLIRKYN
jgi:hypothetical protein